MEIRSYRAVFELERRIYRIDQLRLNPAGVPVRGVVYCMGLLVVMLLLARLPLLGLLVRLAPWYGRDLLLPVALAALLTIIKLEGRPFHLAGLALLRYGVTSRRLNGLERCSTSRWRLKELLILPDGSDGYLRRLRYSGPGVVTVSTAHARSEWHNSPLRMLWRRPNITIAPLSGGRSLRRRQVIQLAPGARLEVTTDQVPVALPIKVDLRANGPQSGDDRR